MPIRAKAKITQVRAAGRPDNSVADVAECEGCLLMKRWNVKLEDVANIDNLRLARMNAMKGMDKETPQALYWLDDRSLYKLSILIMSGHYHANTPNHFCVVDKYTGKTRQIDAPTLRDKIVQHAIVQPLQKKMMGYMIRHTLASLPGRGIEYGRKLLKHFACHGGKQVKYVVKWDIKSFYQAVEIRRVLALLAKRIRDSRVINLIWECLYKREHGLLLGSYLSQWIANIVLSPVDHWVKEEMRVKHYIRYMDDSVAFFSSKKKALQFSTLLMAFVRKLGLTVKTVGRGALMVWKWADQSVDMIAYKTHRNGRQKLRAKIYLSLTRMVRRVWKAGSASRTQARSILSRWGFVKHSDCKSLQSEMALFIKKYRIKEAATYESESRFLQAV